MYRFIDFLIIIFSVFVGLSILIGVGFLSDKIIINFNSDYSEEYDQCKLDLKNTQPICPACKCSFGFFPALIATLLGFFINELFHQYQHHKNKISRKKNVHGK